MNYRDVYEAWLASPALSEAERAELKAIQGDEKEIEGRFFAPLEFGTAAPFGIRAAASSPSFSSAAAIWAWEGFWGRRSSGSSVTASLQ